MASPACPLSTASLAHPLSMVAPCPWQPFVHGMPGMPLVHGSPGMPLVHGGPSSMAALAHVPGVHPWHAQCAPCPRCTHRSSSMSCACPHRAPCLCSPLVHVVLTAPHPHHTLLCLVYATTLFCDTILILDTDARAVCDANVLLIRAALICGTDIPLATPSSVLLTPSAAAMPSSMT